MSKDKIKFPTLYKKTSTGAVQFWDISVEHNQRGAEGTIGAGRITTRYGQLDTDSPQETFDIIETGKNIGKKNETSPYTQAHLEAKAKWEKQKKKGYVESVKAAVAEELDALIEGGIVPMLAHKFSDHGHKIVYPAFVQPKLDGIRCIAIMKDGKCTLWSRTRKPITSMPHIVAQLEAAFPKFNATFDGELYNHAYKANFEHIVSMVRQETPHSRHADVQYHVYDMVTNAPFSLRESLRRQWLKHPHLLHVLEVHTMQVRNEQEAIEAFTYWRSLGYEGAMIRNSAGLYVNKRSYDLQKIKEFDDSEFEIVGVEEGRGKLQGHVGAFVCKTGDGKTFLAKMSGDTAMLKKYFENHKLWKGKKLTVKYQGLTGAEGVPRFPVGVAIRDYE